MSPRKQWERMSYYGTNEKQWGRLSYYEFMEKMKSNEKDCLIMELMERDCHICKTIETGATFMKPMEQVR